MRLQGTMGFAPLNPCYELVAKVADWPFGSFHRYVAEGILTADWAGNANELPGETAQNHRPKGVELAAKGRQIWPMPVISPPAPPQEGIFVLSTPAHMLAKLAWETAQFRRITADQERLGGILFAGYQAFNCAVTAWHCADWVWEYADDHLKKRLADRFSFDLKKGRRTNRDAFFEAVCSDCRELEICRHVANSSKHLKLDPPRDRGFRAMAAHAAKPEQPDRLVFELLIIDRGQPRRALEVFSQALSYWQRLYEELGYVEPRYIDGSSSN